MAHVELKPILFMKKIFKNQTPSLPHKQHCLAGYLMFAVLMVSGSFQFASAQRLVPPPRPAVAPLIGERYANDSDRDRIDDGLSTRAKRAAAAHGAAVTAEQKFAAEVALGEMVNVELIFKEPVTERQMESFIALGGEITYVYKALSYGWNGRMPLGKVSAVRAAMGETLVLVDEARPMEGQIDEATSNGRVRSVWAAGFAGSPAGFSGSTNITIAFVDSGLDETHLDLAGRGVYWSNFTDEATVSAIDLNGHGSHVAGIALGTGAAGGVSGPLFFTHFGDEYRNGNPPPAGSFVPGPLHLPIGSSTLSMTARWLGGGSTSFNRYSRTNGDMGGWSLSATSTGASPLTITTTTVFNPSRIFTPGLLSVGGLMVSNFVVTGVASNYPAIDSFNRVRGVAPGCNWAAAKVARADNTSFTTWAAAALDDLVDQRAARNIKVVNLSISVIGDPGINVALRQKVNSAVNNGIVVVTGTGNGGRGATTGQREADDPSRAELALSVCAANDVNQVTDYTGQGFSSPDSTAGQEEDYKPDVMAPGGSDYYSFILSVDSNNNDGPGFTDQRTNDYVGMKGTSMAVPHVSGCAALVIEALERRGLVWDFSSSEHARYVKMVLCATACESNTNREGNANSPTLQRAASITNGAEVSPQGKDLYEGYGMISAEAAVEAVSQTYIPGSVATNIFGTAVADRRVWARSVALMGGHLFTANLVVPATGDFDLYLYSNEPSTSGTPVILASSTQSGSGVNEGLNYAPGTDNSALLVVKRVVGSGSFTFSAGEVPPPVIVLEPANSNNFIFSFASVAGRTYVIQYKESLEGGNWQFLQNVSGDGTTKTVSDPFGPTQRFYRLIMQ
jgi:hypothetical protein